MVAIAALTAPLPLVVLGASLDGAWLVAINQAHQQHLAWGTQAVWTYGPYGFLDTTVYVIGSNWVWSIIATLAIGTTFVLCWAAFLVEMRAPWWMWLGAGVALLLPMGGTVLLDGQLLLVSMLLLHLAATSRWRFGVLLGVPAGFALALLLLVKGTGAAGAIGLAVCFMLVAAVARKWVAIPLFGGAGLVSFVGLWSLTGPLTSVPAYIRSSYEIISGYSAGSSLLWEWPVPPEVARMEIAIGAAIVIAAILTVLVFVLQRDLRTFSLALMAVPLTFVMFKEAEVRFGTRGAILYATVVMVNVPILWQSLRSRLRWPTRVLPGLSLGLCVLLLVGLGSTAFKAAPPGSPLSGIPARFQEYQSAARVFADPSLQPSLDAQVKQNYRSAYRFSGQFLREMRTGTFDSFPIDAAVAYAYGLDWDPRPVFQSYAAYTPYLDQIDAQHYLGKSAPFHVLFSYFTIDYRYAPFDEPATLRVLMDCYNVVDSQGGFLLLQRKAPVCSVPPLHPLKTVAAPMGSYVTVPQAQGRVYAKVDVQYSLFGRLANLAFQPSELHVRLRYGGSKESPWYRYVAATGPDGLLVSSYLANFQDVAQAVSGQQLNGINGFRISAAVPGEYRPTVKVAFYSDE